MSKDYAEVPNMLMDRCNCCSFIFMAVGEMLFLDHNNG